MNDDDCKPELTPERLAELVREGNERRTRILHEGILNGILETAQSTADKKLNDEQQIQKLTEELRAAKESRQRFVDALAELQIILGLPHPDPKKIIAAVKELKGINRV